MSKPAMLRVLSIFAAAILLLSSCASEPTQANADTGEAVVSNSEETTESLRAVDSLPAMDLEGRTFNILLREEVKYEFDTELTGEIMDDTVYERNTSIGERFNLVINYINQPGLWGSKDTFQKLINSAVSAGDAAYDIVTGQSNIILPLASQGIYVDVSKSQYLDFDQPYWKDGYTENVKIYGRLYTLCGDFAQTALTMSNVIFFNKSLMDEYSIDYPYQLVKDGGWTLDVFIKTATSATADLNGDDVLDADDLHGFAAYNNSVNPLNYSCNVNFTALDENGIRQIIFPNESDISIYDRVYELCHSDSFIDTGKAFSGVTDLEGTMSTYFMNGKFLMMGMILEGVKNLRNMDVDFGIVPYPKADEVQDEYRTSVLRRYTVAAIPITASDSGLSELLLEALGCEGYNEIVPSYYEIALKGKYTRDEDSSEMLDIVCSTSWFDFMDAYYSDLGTLSDFLSGYAFGAAQGVVSKFESTKPGLQANLNKLYDAYAALDG